MITTPKRGGRKGLGGYAPERAEDLQFLAILTETGDFKPYIDRRYAPDQIAEAHAYVGTGRKRGNVAIMMAS
jgi:NADPH:quinone reductase-like Zn-dependent oxidoreductase